MQTNDEALELGREVGGPALIAQVLNVRGELTRVAGEDELARAAYEEGLQISSALDDEMYVSVFLSNLSYLADHRGDHEEARRLTHQALRICWSLGPSADGGVDDLAAGRPRARPRHAPSWAPSSSGRGTRRCASWGPGATPATCPSTTGGGRDPGEPGRRPVRGGATRGPGLTLDAGAGDLVPRRTARRCARQLCTRCGEVPPRWGGRRSVWGRHAGTRSMWQVLRRNPLCSLGCGA